MYRFSFKSILCIATAATLALAGCGPSRSVGQQGTQNPQQQGGSVTVPAFNPNEKVTLALLAPQSGPRQGAVKLGQSLVNAARMGMVDLGERQLELKVYDTGGDPARAGQVARRAMADGADIILGPLFSSSTKSVARVAQPAGIKVLSFSTDASAAGGPVWLTGFLPEMEARRVLSYAASQGRSSVGVFYPQTPYGQAALRGAQQAQREGRTQIVGTGAFQPGFNGVQNGAGAFANASRGADAVLIATSGTDLQAAGTFMDYNNFNPSRVKFLGLGQWFSGATLKERTLRGGWFPAPDVDRSNAFSARYAQKFGAKPRLVAVLGYDAVMVAGRLFRDARASGNRELFPTQLLLRPAGFEGGLGPVRFTRDGLSERSLAILEVGQRNFRTVDPAPRAFGAGS
ncbi:MAG: penicillin-binding protein activator [Pseudomonadota bacterium]